MYLCRTLTDAALSLIGKKLGNRDHTTVIHGYDKIQSEIEMNEKVRNDVEILKKKISP
jgi:chromosomal replication initiator protein